MSGTAAKYSRVEPCRVCGGDLETIYDFGNQALSGRFPGPDEPDAPEAPLELMLCHNCDLPQLSVTVSPDEMFGPGYGYRSGTNPAMVEHLAGVVGLGLQLADRDMRGDVWLDIGCNDGTLLSQLPDRWEKVGFDPCAPEIEGARICRDYFTSRAFGRHAPRRARVVSSLAMVYDLDDPVAFAKEVSMVLEKDGIWIVEFADAENLPGAWDMVCHEHLTYLTAHSFSHIAMRVGFDLEYVYRTETNGGSVLCVMRKSDEPVPWPESTVFDIESIRDTIADSVANIRQTIRRIRGNNKTIDVLGASTKGNTLLQTCGFDMDVIRRAVDRSPEKRGHRTPGTNIPIIHEDDVNDYPDAYLVLPWHFRGHILDREHEFLEQGGKMILPLPTVEIGGYS